MGLKWGHEDRRLYPLTGHVSFLNAFAGGRLFPGVHHRARFDVRETETEYHIVIDNIDGSAHVTFDRRATDALPDDSVFDSVADCSRFFEDGSLGYSPVTSTSQFDGLELRAFNWRVQPFAVTTVKSSFFDDRDAFPRGSVAFDNALLMRDIDHEWHSRESLCCAGG